jgi:hypothetical protein
VGLRRDFGRNLIGYNVALAKSCTRLITEEQFVCGEPSYTAIIFRKGMAGSVTVDIRALADVRQFQLFRNQVVDVCDNDYSRVRSGGVRLANWQGWHNFHPPKMIISKLYYF